MSDTNYIITSDGTFMSDNELRHYGIKGMKWGVRRYQNADGSLTDAGRRRLQKQDAAYAKKYPDRAKKASELRDAVIENDR